MSTKINGIDVSKWQGAIDWQRVAASGVRFAMIRLGTGSPDGSSCTLDPRFDENVEGALAAGLEVGCYLYSYATSAAGARMEAAFAAGRLAKYKGRLCYPVAFDLEDPSQAALGRDALTGMADAFCGAIEANGWYAMLYCNKNWATNYLEMAALARYDLWLAEWRDAPSYTGRGFNLWQRSNKGQVPGIAGSVDLDTAYMDFAAVIREKGLNGCRTAPKKSVDQLAAEVIAGKWGNGAERREKLTAAGYDYDAVQAAVNAKLGSSAAPAKKSVDELAAEVIAGKWGNGAERREKLTAAGYDYGAVQAAVNAKLAAAKKSDEEIAKEVLAGAWGNGAERRQKLTAAGYNYDAVQRIVNRLV